MTSARTPTEILAKAVAAEAKAFEKAAKVANETDYARSGRNLLLAQEWFDSLALLLDVYRSVRTSPSSPEDAALGRLQGLTRTFAQGKIPDPVKLAVDVDGNAWWPGEQDDVATAIFYIEAAKAGRIADNAYNKTVRDAYYVTAPTVRRWIKDRDRICKGRKPVADGNLARDLIKRGARFQKYRSGRKPKPK